MTRLPGRFGPQLGRPQVDTLNGSQHAKHEGDAARQAEDGRLPSLSTPSAALVVAGDKSGGGGGGSTVA